MSFLFNFRRKKSRRVNGAFRYLGGLLIIIGVCSFLVVISGCSDGGSSEPDAMNKLPSDAQSEMRDALLSGQKVVFVEPATYYRSDMYSEVWCVRAKTSGGSAYFTVGLHSSGWSKGYWESFYFINKTAWQEYCNY